MSKQHAIDFFEQLGEFSARYVKAELGLDSAISPWGITRHTVPLQLEGAVIHYTADEDLLRVLRWFLVEKYQAKTSAHAVIADRRMASHDELAHDLPLILELPSTIIQTRLPSTVAWHATWTNYTSYGIENVNAGPLKRNPTSTEGDADSFTSWRPRDRSSPDWTLPWAVPYKEPVQVNGRWWAPYTPCQIESNVILLRYVQDFFEDLKRVKVVGHEAVQSNKSDPGPTFPIHGVRDAVFDGWGHAVHSYDWYKQWAATPSAATDAQDAIILDFARSIGGEGADPTVSVAWARFESSLAALPDKSHFGITGKTALKLLGYYMPSPGQDALEATDFYSICIFQTMAGLRTDSIPGRITKRALYDRVADRGFFKR